LILKTVTKTPGTVDRSILFAVGSTLAAILASLSCLGLWAVITLGVSGLGWLTHLSGLRIPGALLALIMVALAVRSNKLKQSQGCCQSRVIRFMPLFFAVLTILLLVIEFIYIPFATFNPQGEI